MSDFLHGRDYKFKLGSYVVYNGFVYTVETVWHGSPPTYELWRVVGGHNKRTDRIAEKELKQWDGTSK